MADAAVVLVGAGRPVGRQLAFRLAAEGIEQRLIVPGTDREPRLPDDAPLPESEAFVIGHEPAHSQLDAVLTGADTLVIAGSAAEDPDPVTLVRSATDHGVRRIVHLSQIGAAEQAIALPARRHHRIETEVRASGAAWTILQVSVQFGAIIRAVHDGVLRAPTGQGRAAVVSHADVADAATAVLLDEREHAHDRVTYRITGPEALTGREVAAILSRVTSRPVTYEPTTSRDIYASPVPWVHDLDAWISCCAAVDAGIYEQVDDAVSRLAGRPARTLEGWLDDYPSEWARLAGDRFGPWRAG